MNQRALFDKIDLSLIRVLHTVITESSVSRAAVKLRSNQPAVSAQLRRLRELTGDPLLVRSGQGMAPTDVALSLVEPAATILQQAQWIFGDKSAARGFDPATAEVTFRVAATDYLDPWFLPELTLRLRRLAPHSRLEVLPLGTQLDHRRSLARGEVDLVIGNWLEPSEELHLGRLLSDELVCLVSEDHPAARLPKEGKRSWSVEQYLAAEHIAPLPFHPDGPGIIEQHLQAKGLERRIVVRHPHFAQIPYMVAGSLLVFIPAVGEFVIPDLLGGPGSLMIGRSIWMEFFANRDWPFASAVAIVLLVTLVAPIVLYQRQQARALEAGR